MSTAPEFPDAALSASRDVHTDLPVPLTAGALPPGLAGHLFVMSTCGSVDSGGAPYPDDNDRPTVINGDGMVWRFDFVAPAPGDAPAVTVSNAIIKPPDYHYDELTKNGEPLDFAGFGDVGMLRASLFLGTRNYGNTALLPLPDSGGGGTRLICCYDAGPPVEIDPVSLATLDVVGKSWDPEALDGLVPFPPILATAHPMYDPDRNQLFAVNYGRSTASMIETVPLLETLAFLPEEINDVIGRTAAALGVAPIVSTLAKVPGRVASWLTHARRGFIRHQRESPIPVSFLDLVVWPGHGDITRLPVVDVATGKLAEVEESMHQIAITRRFVLLLDTNFKLRFDQFYNNPFPWVPVAERLFRTSVGSEQGTTSNLWIIRRDDVDHALGATSNRSVPAWKVPLPGAVHFLADFDDSDGIRIQCAHGNALDIAEWVRPDDQRLDGSTVREVMHGMIASAVDTSELGRYVIDPAQRRIVESQRLGDDRLFSIALYAARGVPAWDRVPERLTHSYWFSSGLWQDTYTLYIRALYADYPGRRIPMADMDAIIRAGGTPSTLVCVELDSLTICDHYAFDPGVTLSSPQFIPDPARAGDRGGWITTVVWTRDKSHLWVFDAEDLEGGPIAQLEVPATLGFSLHSAWLPTITPRPPPTGVAAPSLDDLRERLERLKPSARKRLEKLLARLL